MNMQKFRYFELNEFIASQEAKARGIDNIPSFEVVEHLEELVGNILEPLRAAWGKPITITSGYRSPKLNQVVGGSSTSVHKIGYAADLQSYPFIDFVNFTKDFLRARGIRFDQMLIEENKRKKTKWLHIGIRGNRGEQRGEIKEMNV